MGEGGGHGTGKTRYSYAKKNEIGPLSYDSLLVRYSLEVSQNGLRLIYKTSNYKSPRKKEKKLIDIDLGNFLDIIPKVQATKAIIK